MADSFEQLSHKARLGHWLTLTLLSGLILLFIYWSLIRSIGFSFSILALQALPLLALAPGMLKKYYRSYSWLCFILLFYFIFAAQLVLSSKGDWSDWLFTLLIVLLFIASMMTSRWTQHVQKFDQLKTNKNASRENES